MTIRVRLKQLENDKVEVKELFDKICTHESANTVLRERKINSVIYRTEIAAECLKLMMSEKKDIVIIKQATLNFPV